MATSSNNSKQVEDPKDHRHSYRRHPTRKGYYFCTGKECFAIHEKAILVGKEARCPACLKLYLLTSEDLRRARPVCPNCSGTKEARAFRKGKSLIEGLFTTPEPVEEKTVGEFKSEVEEQEAFLNSVEEKLKEPLKKEEVLPFVNPFKLGRF